MSSRLRLALGPALAVAALWLVHRALLEACLRGRLVEQVLGGGGELPVGKALVVMGFVAVRLMLYLLGPGLAVVAASYLLRRAPERPAVAGGGGAALGLPHDGPPDLSCPPAPTGSPPTSSSAGS